MWKPPTEEQAQAIRHFAETYAIGDGSPNQSARKREARALCKMLELFGYRITQAEAHELLTT